MLSGVLISFNNGFVKKSPKTVKIKHNIIVEISAV